MPRARTPLAKAEATGRTEHDPKRFARRNEPHAEPLGDPSFFFDDLQIKAWNAFKREIPWLKESDRSLMEIACQLRVQIWTGIFDMKTVAQLRMCLNSMGATPADRSKIITDEAGSEDPADKYFS